MSNSQFADENRGSPTWNTLAFIASAVMASLVAVQIFAKPIWIGFVALSAFASLVCGLVAVSKVMPKERERWKSDTRGDSQAVITLLSLCVLAVTLVWWGVTRWPWF